MGKATKRPGRGGARKGAGRKPLTDPKIPLTLYIEESIVKELGGVERVRNDCYEFIKHKKSKK